VTPSFEPRPTEKRNDERTVREAALDRTIENSFPASDPPSSIPDPYDPASIDVVDRSATPLSADQLNAESHDFGRVAGCCLRSTKSKA
jgi:hypothetical protein